MRKLINTVRVLTGVIAAIGAVASYTTQAHLLMSWGVESYLAWTIPLTVDCLAIICSLVVHTHGIDEDARRIAYRVLGVALTTSITANALSGESVGARVTHVWCVVVYMLGEMIVAKIKAKRPVDTVDHAAEAAALRDQLTAATAAHAAQLLRVETDHAAAIADLDAAADKERRSHARKLAAARRAHDKALTQALADRDVAHTEQLTEAIAVPSHASLALAATPGEIWVPPTHGVPAVLALTAGTAPVSPAPYGS